MPSGKRIDWSQYDQLLLQYLSKMTIADWGNKYAPHISIKAIGVRSRKIGAKPKPYTPSEEHKKSISDTISKVTPKMVQFVKDNIDDYSRRELSDKIGISVASLARLINRHKIKLTKKGQERARKASTNGSLGKTPWNKNSTLSEETKSKISKAVSGENNGQFGCRMTAEEANKWRTAYRQNGVHNMRAWIESEVGQACLNKTRATMATDEYLTAASERACEMVRQGKIKFRGKPSKMDTKKGGKFTTKSTYETRFVELLEADPNVVKFVYEPFKIPYKYNKRMKNYIPDFLVEYIDGREELIEVKPAKLVGLKRNKAKIRAGHNHELAFRVVTEEDLGL